MTPDTQPRLTCLQYCKQELNKAVVKQKEEGFTLIELLLVIGIIAILAAIVIIAINPTANIQSAQNAAANKQAREIQNAITQHIIEYGAAPDGLTSTPQVLCTEGFLPVSGECEVALFDPVPTGLNSLQEFVPFERAASADANNLEPGDSGFRISTDNVRYFVEPVVSGASPLVASVFEANFGGSVFEYATDMQQTADDGYILLGYTVSNDGDVGGNNGSLDYWLVKTNSSGALQWEQNYGGSNDDFAYSLDQTSDGGYIIAGSTRSNDGDVTAINGGSDFWVVKTSSTGVIEWEQTYGGSSDDTARSVQQTSDGGYIISGASTSNDGDVSGNSGASDYWLVKINSTGVLEWEQNFGGTSADTARSVQQTSDGGYIIAGDSSSSNGDVGGNNGSRDYWVVKTNSTGVLEWEQNYGGTLADLPNSIIQTSDGGYIIGGNTSSNNGDVGGNNGFDDVWVAKINSTGVLEWEQNFGGTDDEFAYSIKQTSDGGYIIVADTYSTDVDVSENNGDNDMWVVKMSSTGVLEWEQNYGGSGFDFISGNSEIGAAIEQTSDGGYAIFGSTGSSDLDVSSNNGSLDFWLVKVGSDGVL